MPLLRHKALFKMLSQVGNWLAEATMKRVGHPFEEYCCNFASGSLLRRNGRCNFRREQPSIEMETGTHNGR